jgi:hypothetical protein
MLQREPAAARRALAAVQQTRQRLQACASSSQYPRLQQECQEILLGLM